MFRVFRIHSFVFLGFILFCNQAYSRVGIPIDIGAGITYWDNWLGCSITGKTGLLLQAKNQKSLRGVFEVAFFSISKEDYNIQYRRLGGGIESNIPLGPIYVQVGGKIGFIKSFQINKLSLSKNIICFPLNMGIGKSFGIFDLTSNFEFVTNFGWSVNLTFQTGVNLLLPTAKKKVVARKSVPKEKFKEISYKEEVSESELEKEIEATPKPEYIRKSISYIPVLLVTNRNLLEDLDEEKVNYILKTLREFIEMDRFDYNPLPEEVYKKFINAVSMRDSISREELRKYIDSLLVPEIRKILELNAEIRAKELVSEEEKASFVATKAKEIGITTEDIEAILNAAYIYVPVCTYYEIKEKGKEYQCKIGLDIDWYHIVYEKNEYKAELMKRSYGFGPLDKYAGKVIELLTGIKMGLVAGFARSDEDCKWEGKPVSPDELAFYRAVEQACRNLEVQTRSLTPFKLSSRIQEASGNYVKFNLGKKEGVKLDFGFEIYETIRTKKGKLKDKKIGFVKVRKVGDNTRTPIRLSKAQILLGSKLDRGMIVVEHPRLGQNISLRFEYLPFTVDTGLITYEGFPLAHINKVKGVPYGVNIGAELDLAPILKTPLLCETYVTGDFTIGMVFLEMTTLTGFEKVRSNISALELGIMKKLFLHRFALITELKCGSEALMFESPYDTSAKISATSFGITPIAGFECILVPDLSISLKGGYKLYPALNIWEYSEEGNRYKLDGPEYSFSGPYFNLGLVYTPMTLPFDPFARLRPYIEKIKKKLPFKKKK